MSNNKELERAELHKTIWRIANDLRGSVDGWDFKTYGKRSANPPCAVDGDCVIQRRFVRPSRAPG